jgi:DNA-binding MarR family transcriptional regulator
MTKENKSTKINFPPLLHLTSFLQQSADEKLLQEAGVGISYARIMAVLDSGDSSSQQTIASVLHQTQSNVSRQVKAMKKDGLVSINASKNDKRQHDVALTAKGKRTWQKAHKLLQKQEQQLLKRQSKKDAKVFAGILDSLLNEL